MKDAVFGLDYRCNCVHYSISLVIYHIALWSFCQTKIQSTFIFIHLQVQSQIMLKDEQLKTIVYSAMKEQMYMYM